MTQDTGNTDLQDTLDLVLRYGWSATAYQIVNPGIQRWFTPARDAVVGYVEYYGVRVVAGAPVCATERLADVVAQFEEASHSNRVCYFGAEQRMIEALPCDRSHAHIVLGAQPAWDPRYWDAMLSGHASLRAQLNRARNKDVAVELWDSARASGNRALQDCLEAWLGSRGLPPLHFLIEPQTLERLFDRLVFVALQGGGVVGFLVASPIPLRGGWLIEQNIRCAEAPNGTAELLIDAAVREMAARGNRYVTLGLSPISQHAEREREENPAWLNTVLRLMRAYGRRLYNFEGLDSFKTKFQAPQWETVYAIANENNMSLRTLYATAAAFAGENPLRTLGRKFFRRRQ